MSLVEFQELAFYPQDRDMSMIAWYVGRVKNIPMYPEGSVGFEVQGPSRYGK